MEKVDEDIGKVWEYGAIDYDKLTYGGINVTQDPTNRKKFKLDQNHYLTSSNLKLIQIQERTEAEFKKVCKGRVGATLWLACSTEPLYSFEASYSGSLVTQDGPQEDKLRYMNRFLKKLKTHPPSGYEFEVTDCKEWCLITFWDAAFANLPGSGSQTGCMVYLAPYPIREHLNSENQLSAVPIYWDSKKSSRVCRSTLSAECDSAVNAIDKSQWISLLIEELLGPNFLKKKYGISDCKSLIEASMKVRPKSVEKRVQLDLMTLVEHRLKHNWAYIHCASCLQKADYLTKTYTSSMTASGMPLNIIQFDEDMLQQLDKQN